VRIYLNNYKDLLEAHKGKKMDKGTVLEFVSRKVLELESLLEMMLFEKCIEENDLSNVVVMVDGFDNISPKYKETVIEILQVLKQTSLGQLWVTTRPHLQEDLEDSLQKLSYTLQPFSEFEQTEFLNKFWVQCLDLEFKNEHQLESYATSLIQKLAQSISDKDKAFTGIPLQTHVLAEAFEEDFRSFYVSEKSEPELTHKLDLLGLYRRFIDRKYDIYYLEQFKTPVRIMAAEELRERSLKCIQLEHQRLALETLFTEDQVTLMQIDRHSTFSYEELSRIGIVQITHEGKPQFIHHTVAEYYVADFLINQLTKENEQHSQIQDILINEVLSGTNYQITRSFVNSLFEKFKTPKEALKLYSEKLHEQWNESEAPETVTVVTTALHTAAIEDNANIIGFLLDSLNSRDKAITLKTLMMAEDKRGQTALHMAAVGNSLHALNKMWELVGEVTPTLTHSLLLSQDKDSKTAWILAVEGSHIKVLQILWSWAKEAQINPSELKNELLFSQVSEGRTAWHVAAQMGSVELTDKLWSWAKDVLPGHDLLKNKLLLSRDKNSINAWDLAERAGSLEILGKLCSWAKELQLEPQEFRNDLLLCK
jgi:hypothetical protein